MRDWGLRARDFKILTLMLSPLREQRFGAVLCSRSERHDRDSVGQDVTSRPGIEHYQVLEFEISQGDLHGPRQRGCISAFASTMKIER